MQKFTKRLWSNEEGATAIEYGLLAALIAVVLIGALIAVGGQLESTFQEVATQLENNAPAGGGGGGGGGEGGE